MSNWKYSAPIFTSGRATGSTRRAGTMIGLCIVSVNKQNKDADSGAEKGACGGRNKWEKEEGVEWKDVRGDVWVLGWQRLGGGLWRSSVGESIYQSSGLAHGQQLCELVPNTKALDPKSRGCEVSLE